MRKEGGGGGGLVSLLAPAARRVESIKRVKGSKVVGIRRVVGLGVGGYRVC